MTEQPPAPNTPATPTPPTTPGTPAPPTTAWAIAALIFGIIGASLIGIICGVIALAKIKTGQFAGRTMAIIGLILSGLWIVIGIIAVVAILLLDSDDTSSPGSRQYVPAAGTCFAEDPDSRFDQTMAIPCGQEHRVEVFAAYTVAGDAFPSQAAIDRYVNRCGTEFAQYAAEDAANADIYDLRPTEATWAQGDRIVVCYAMTPEPVTGSLKG